MARLNIRWETKSTVAPKAATTGDTQAEAEAAAASTHADRPMLIYVTSDDATDSTTRKLEDVAFADERVGIGSKFFQCVKVTNGNALQDRLLKETGDSTPRLIFVTREYEVMATLDDRKLKPGTIVKTMAKLARAEYKDNFSSMVSKYAKLLNELDRLDGVRTRNEETARKLQEKPNASKQKKHEREVAEYNEAMENWKKEEEKLLEFKPKPLKKPAST
jgi:hypothetical protein